MKTNKKKNPSKFARFLWWTAGADQSILLRSTHSDRVKYLTLGGIILATGLMASLAGGYAFYTIFSPKGDALGTYKEVVRSTNKSKSGKSANESNDKGVAESQFKPNSVNFPDYQEASSPDSAVGLREESHTPTVMLSLVFGLLWGLMIFNIDRFIVTSTGTGDGTEKITWDEFKGAIPRLVMGTIIAITISKPVEIRMFKSEIDAELHMAQQKQAARYEKETRAKYMGDLNRIQSEIDILNSRTELLLQDVLTAEKEYTDETRGVRGNGRGVGPVAEALNEKVKEKKQLLNAHKEEIKSELANLKAEKQKKLASLEEELKNNVKVASALDGLLERIKLAHKIAGWKITLFITLLFLVIELTPIFFKLMLIKSPYDYLLENEKELVKARAGIYIEYNYYPPEDDDGVIREGTERHLVRLLQKEKENLERLELLEAQKRLTQYAIKKFEDAQMKLIDSNPEQYVSINDNQETKES